MEDTRIQFRWLLGASLLFFAVYVAIHVLLNYYAQGSANPQSSLCPLPEADTHSLLSGHAHPWWMKFTIELSGPVTISICSTLLILSYGSFLIHGLKHLSVSLPNAFLKAFLIFIVGQVLVQFVGHAEIFVTNYTIACGPPPKWIAIPSAFSYTVAFSTLYILENYEYRVFDSLRHQIPEPEVRHGLDALVMARLTAGSIVLILLKLIIVGIDGNAKFGAVALTLILEFCVAIFVISHLRKRSVGSSHAQGGGI